MVKDLKGKLYEEQMRSAAVQPGEDKAEERPHCNVQLLMGESGGASTDFFSLVT